MATHTLSEPIRCSGRAGGGRLDLEKHMIDAKDYRRILDKYFG